jgi:hypothetical protein
MKIDKNEVVKELEVLKKHLKDIGDTETNPNSIEVLDDAIELIKKL